MAVTKYLLPEVIGNPAQGRLYLMADTEAEVPVAGINPGDMCYAKDTGKLWKRNQGNTWDDAGASVVIPPAPKLLRKTADQNHSLNTFIDVADLTFPVLANTDYAFEFTVVYRSAATTTGIRLAVNGPLAPTLIAYRVETQRANAALSATGAVDNIAAQSVAAYDGPAADTGVAAANTDYIARVVGVLQNGINAGTLALRVASEVATSQVTIKKGSWGLYF